MKPLEILGMVEEACGTRLYEVKKSQAEKTMEKKDSKVNEINKILNEDITPTLEKLRAQRSAYLQWASNSTEIERLRRQRTAFEYYNACEYLREGNEENRLITEELNLKDANDRLSNSKAELESRIQSLESLSKDNKTLEDLHKAEIEMSKKLVKENSNHVNEIQSLDRDKQELRRLEERVRQSSVSLDELSTRLRVSLNTEINY